MTGLSLYSRHEEEAMTSGSLVGKEEKGTLTSKSLTNMQEEHTMTSMSLGTDREEVAFLVQPEKRLFVHVSNEGALPASVEMEICLGVGRCRYSIRVNEPCHALY